MDDPLLSLPSAVENFILCLLATGPARKHAQQQLGADT